MTYLFRYNEHSNFDFVNLSLEYDILKTMFLTQILQIYSNIPSNILPAMHEARIYFTIELIILEVVGVK